jgi:RNA recognition motif. (a.k.a. RRM, RBD, or RNP domain)
MCVNIAAVLCNLQPFAFSRVFANCSGQSRLPPEVNRILYVRNLPFNISAEELYTIFGKYGAIYQIRLGDKTKGTNVGGFSSRRLYHLTPPLFEYAPQIPAGQPL